MPEQTTRNALATRAQEKRRQFFLAYGCEAEEIRFGPAEYLVLCQDGPVREIAGLPVRVDAQYTVAAVGRLRRWKGGRSHGG